VPYVQWIREGLIEATPGEVIDYDRIRGRVNELGERYDIRLAISPNRRLAPEFSDQRERANAARAEARLWPRPLAAPRDRHRPLERHAVGHATDRRRLRVRGLRPGICQHELAHQEAGGVGTWVPAGTRRQPGAPLDGRQRLDREGTPPITGSPPKVQPRADGRYRGADHGAVSGESGEGRIGLRKRTPRPGSD